MDSKTWLWKKRSLEKTIIVNGDTDGSSLDHREKVSFDEKELILQESLDLLNDKLASILRECDVKDELVAEYAEKAENAMAGKEKAESEVTRLKEELNESLRQRAAENERISQLNAALRGSMQQLNLVREEQEKRICEAVMTISNEHQEASEWLTSLTAENAHLKTALIEKEMLVRELSKCKAQTEAELDVLLAKSDSMEKDNLFMRYELRRLEKELDVCNEEITFSQYSLIVSNKESIECSKKMKKLEEECQRLQGLLLQHLPCPDSLDKITREGDLQSTNLIQSRTRKLQPKIGCAVVRNSVMGSLHGNLTQKMDMLMERLRYVEEENKVLKKILLRRDGDNNYSISSVFRQFEVDCQHKESYIFPEHGPYSKASSESGKDCRILSSQSSASSTLSDVDQCKHEDSKNMLLHKTLGVSDISLMDDFLEMEKLAIVAVNSNGSSTDTERALAEQIYFKDKDLDDQILDVSPPFDWIQHVTGIIMNQHKVSGRRLKELVEDFLISLQKNDSLGDGDACCLALGSMDQHQFSGVRTCRPLIESQEGSSTDEILSDENLLASPRSKIPQSDIRESIHKIMELIRRLDQHFPEENVESLEGLEREENASKLNQTSAEAKEVTHAFTWRKFEISAAINRFLNVCDNMLEGKVNTGKFAEELASELSFLINSCVSVQVSSNLKDEHLMERPWDENDMSSCGPEQSKEIIRSLQAQLETLGEAKRLIEVEIQNQKSTNEDINDQLIAMKDKLNEDLQKLPLLEEELEQKTDYCEELEQKCLELQLQLEWSTMDKNTQKDDVDSEGTLDQIVSSSSKDIVVSLMRESEINGGCDECEESFIDPTLNNRFSLLEHMQLEDSTEEAKKGKSESKHVIPLLLHAPPKVGLLPIVPSKKKGGTIKFLKKLMYKRRRRSNRKLSFSLTT